MQGFLSVINYTTKRHNLLIGIIAFFVITIVILSLFATVDKESIDTRDKEVIIQSYKDIIQFEIDMLEVEKRDAFRAVMQDKIDYYSYFVDTNTVESEYYNIGGSTTATINNREGHEGSAFMFYSFKWLSYVIYILAVVIPLMLFVLELGGPIKNIIATSLTRNKIYNYFYLESFILVSVINFIAFEIGLVGGMMCKDDSILLIQNGYREVSTIGIYCWACLGRYILSLLFVNVVTLVGIRTKNVSLTCIYFGLIIATAIVVGLMVSPSIFNESEYNYSDPLVKLPIVGVDANQVGITTDSIIMIVYHSLITVALYFGGLAYFRKKNI